MKLSRLSVKKGANVETNDFGGKIVKYFDNKQIIVQDGDGNEKTIAKGDSKMYNGSEVVEITGLKSGRHITGEYIMSIAK